MNPLISGITCSGISRHEAGLLSKSSPAEELLSMATEVRRRFAPAGVDICAIVNAKSGMCPENCAFCAQSAAHGSNAGEYPLIDDDSLFSQAKENEKYAVRRFSIVTSGARLDDSEFLRVVGMVRRIRAETSMHPCVSIGSVTPGQASMLKEAGLGHLHHNLETGRNFFHRICSTHTYDEKIATIQAAMSAGLGICSGGIVGMGESMEDRLDMIFELKELGVRFIPVNILDPVKGTPLEGIPPIQPIEVLRTLALFRLVIPDAVIRYAGGRANLGDSQKTGLLTAVNGMMVGNYLTKSGMKISDDLAMLDALGLKH